ncbi:hypothetical protein PILCRDRAFT_348195 [Piloderma croceum F 1598]|uniref:WW domain-containing protein n=1 Tax=Piloderma croceum (strain F 1598) TaxID=765440 RepID=A0A0C3FM53_PILCF|nr:hypothetical protein PILCRDRAFT_348195 [Piloderma croceum F 1598]
MSDQPLPYGWVQEMDPTHNHPYYVDTKATPPRSIWVHPYEDEQYLSEHPEVREKENRRHSFGGEGSERLGAIAGSSSNTALDNPPKKGVFAKLKDKAIGTKEEREAEKRHRAEVCSHISCDANLKLTSVPCQLHRLRQQQYQERLAALQQQRQQQFAGRAYVQQMYASPDGAPYQYGGYGGGRRGGGMGGMGLPILGGLAGGLLLGDMLGGGFGGDGGDFGGDGGDFGGGDFGGF